MSGSRNAWDEIFASEGKPPALVVGERQTPFGREALDDLFEHADLFLGVVELFLHPLVERTGEHDNEKIEYWYEHGGAFAREGREDKPPIWARSWDNWRRWFSGQHAARQQCGQQSRSEGLGGVSSE